MYFHTCQTPAKSRKSSKVKKEHPKLHLDFSYAAILLANVELIFFCNHILHEFLLAKMTNWYIKFWDIKKRILGRKKVPAPHKYCSSYYNNEHIFEHNTVGKDICKELP